MSRPVGGKRKDKPTCSDCPHFCCLRSPARSRRIVTSGYLYAKFLHNGVSLSYDLFSRVHCAFNLEVSSVLHFMATCSLSAVYLGRVHNAVNDKQKIPPRRLTSSVLHI